MRTPEGNEYTPESHWDERNNDQHGETPYQGDIVTWRAERFAQPSKPSDAVDTLIPGTADRVLGPLDPTEIQQSDRPDNQ